MIDEKDASEQEDELQLPSSHASADHSDQTDHKHDAAGPAPVVHPSRPRLVHDADIAEQEYEDGRYGLQAREDADDETSPKRVPFLRRFGAWMTAVQVLEHLLCNPLPAQEAYRGSHSCWKSQKGADKKDWLFFPGYS